MSSFLKCLFKSFDCFFFFLNWKYSYFGLPCGLLVKSPPAVIGDLGLIPGLGRSPGEGNGNPLQYSYLGNPTGQRCLVGYSPQGHKESDMTEQLNNNEQYLLYNVMLVSAVQQSEPAICVHISPRV